MSDLKVGERSGWLDFLRGICIIMVVIGHSGTNEYLLRCIYLVHLPCFFSISGYLTWLRISNGKELDIPKRVIGLLRPYLLVGVIAIAVHFLGRLLTSRNSDAPLTVAFEQAIGLVLGVRGTSPACGAIWFLMIAALVEITITPLCLLARKNGITRLVVVVGSAGAFLSIGKLDQYREFCIDVLPFAAFFYLLPSLYFSLGGSFLARVSVPKYLPIVAVVLFALLAVLKEQRLDVYSQNYGSGFSSVLLSAGGVGSLFWLCRTLEPSGFIARIGRDSLSILCFHQWLIMQPLWYLCKVVLGGDFERSSVSLPVSILAVLGSWKILEVVRWFYKRLTSSS